MNPGMGMRKGPQDSETLQLQTTVQVKRVNKNAQSSVQSTQQYTYHLQQRVGPKRTETFSSVTTLFIITCLSCVFLPKAVFLATTLSHLKFSLELYLTRSLTPA